MNKPTVNIYMQFLYGHKFSTHLGKYQGEKILELYGKSMFVSVCFLFIKK